MERLTWKKALASLKNENQNKLMSCTCGSNDVFMRKCFIDKPDKFSIKCNYCNKEQKEMYPTPEDSEIAWNREVKNTDKNGGVVMSKLIGQLPNGTLYVSPSKEYESMGVGAVTTKLMMPDIMQKLHRYEEIGTPEEFRGTKDYVKEYVKYIDKLPKIYFDPDNGWIPVVDRLPRLVDSDEYGCVLTTRLGRVMITSFDEVNSYNAMAWMPLPEKYKQKESEGKACL